MQQPAPVWTRDFSWLWTANFLMAVSFYFLLPTVPAFAVSVLGADAGQVGYLIGTFTLTAVLIRPLAGYALDTLGRRGVYLWSLAGFALLIPGYILAASFAAMLLIRLLHGVTWGGVTAGGFTAAADLVPPARRGEGLGYFGMSMTLAMALGPLLGLQVAGGGRYDRLFYVAGALALAALAVAMLVRYPRVARARAVLSWEAIIEPRVLPVAVLTLAVGVGYGGIVSFITLFSAEIGIANGGIFFLAYAIAVSLSRPLAGKLMDRRGPLPVTITGFISLMVGFVLLSASHGHALFAAAAVLLGIGNGNVMPTLQAMTVNLVEPERRGAASSTYMSFLDGGIGLGSVVLGWIAGATSISVMYLVSGGLMLLPLVYVYWYVQRRYYRSLPGRHA